MFYYHMIIEYKLNNYPESEVIIADSHNENEIQEKVNEFKNNILISSKGYNLKTLKECRLRIFRSKKSAYECQKEQNKIKIDDPSIMDLYYSLDHTICVDGFAEEITSLYF